MGISYITYFSTVMRHESSVCHRDIVPSYKYAMPTSYMVRRLQRHSFVFRSFVFRFCLRSFCLCDRKIGRHLFPKCITHPYIWWDNKKRPPYVFRSIFRSSILCLWNNDMSVCVTVSHVSTRGSLFRWYNTINNLLVKIDCHTVGDHLVQYNNLVYVSLVVTCFPVLMV